jgi:hypothetical protein
MDITARVLESLKAYCKAFSANIGHHFTIQTIRLTALTGTAAVEIGGETTTREFGLKRKKRVNVEDIDQWKDTRINIIDEISFAGQADLEKLSRNLQAYTECFDQIYGNIAICFIGDFCQLPVIKGIKIYIGPPTMYWEQALTTMVELDGHHRYAEDRELGKAMAEARNGDARNIRKMLSKRILTEGHVQMPRGLASRYATFTNVRRAVINGNIFKKYLAIYHTSNSNLPIPEGAIVIRGHAQWYTSRKSLGHAAHRRLWEHCSDGHVQFESKRADPFLSLFYGCELMVTENENVKFGVANGTSCTFEKAVLKSGASKHRIKVHGLWVYAVDIWDVDHLVLRFEKKKMPCSLEHSKLRHNQNDLLLITHAAMKYPTKNERK